MTHYILKAKHVLSLIFIIARFTAHSQGVSELIIDPSTFPISNNQLYNEVARDRIVIKPGMSYTPLSSSVYFKAKLDESIVAPVTYSVSQASVPMRNNLNTILEVGGSPIACDVGSIGQATSSMMIQVPPGTAGMQPQLSVHYQSQQANGLLGYGWDLAGLSSISRTGNTPFYGSEFKSVSFDYSDNFMLDGQRLILVSGSMYETESKSYSEITSHGTAGDGPEWFSVKTKAGMYMEFGNTQDSKIMASGGTVANWRLNKVMDASGNYTNYIYNTTSTESVIIKIEYTGNSSAGLAPYNYVQFYYDLKSDANTTWINGLERKNSLVLRQIKTFAEGSLVKTYSFKYGKDLYTKLLEMDETGANGESYNPVLISWSAAGMSSVTTTTPSNLPLMTKGDFDGDGRTDLILYSYGATTNQMILYTSDGSAHAIPYNVDALSSPIVVAMNNEGNDNIDEIYIHYASGSQLKFAGFQYVASTGSFVPISSSITGTDFGFVCGNNIGVRKDVQLNKVILNGDYRNTAVVVSRICNDYSTKDPNVVLSVLAPYTNILPAELTNTTNHTVRFLDINGNGRTDIVELLKMPVVISSSLTQYKTAIKIYEYSSSVGGYQKIVDLPNLLAQEDFIDFGDFNGDGYVDLLSHCSSNPNLWDKTWRTFMFNGINYNSGTVVSEVDQVIGDYLSVVTGDFDGDNRTDILCNPPSAPPSVTDEMQRICKTIIKSSYLTSSINYQSLFDAITNDVVNSYQNAIDNNLTSFVFNLDGDLINEIRQFFTPTANSSDYTIFIDGINVKKAIGFSRLKQYIITKHNANLPPLSVSWWDKFTYAVFSQPSKAVRAWSAPNYTWENPNLILFRNNGSSYEAKANSVAGLQGLQGCAIADFNGDGMADLYANIIDDNFIDRCQITLLNTGNSLDHYVDWISDRMNNYTVYSYAPITGNYSQTNSVYNGIPGLYSGSFGSFTAPLMVVKNMIQRTADATILGMQKFSYQDAVYHKLGKGFIGFRSITRTDTRNYANDYMVTATNYLNTDYAFFYPANTQKSFITSGGIQTIQSSVNEYEFEVGAYPGGVYVFRPKKQTNTDYLTDITSITEFVDYDFFGNVNKQSVSFANSGTVAITENTYTTVGFSIPNKIQQQRVTHQRAGQSDIITVTDFIYNSNGSLQRSTGYNLINSNRTIVNDYQYNSFGLLTRHSTLADGKGKGENYVYDNKGRFVTEEYNVLNQKTTRTFDTKYGGVLTQTDIDGKVISNIYNGFGRLIQQTDKRGIVTTYSKSWINSNASASLFEEHASTPNTPTLTTIYDNLGRKVKTSLESNGTMLQTSYEYDLIKLSLLKKEWKPYTVSPNKYVTYVYDDYNRIQSVTDDGRVTTTNYGQMGSKTTSTTTIYPDPSKNQVSSVTIGTDGVVLNKTDNGGLIQYVYYADGKPQTIDAAGIQTAFTYDEFGYQTTLYDPNAGLTYYQYNGLGELVKQTNPDANTIEMSYDAASRVTRRILNANNPASAQTTTYVYVSSGNGINQVRTVSNGQVNQLYAYDEWGNPISVTENIGSTNYLTTFAYDNKGQNTSVVYPSGFGITKEYDALGRVSAIKRTDNGQPLWQAAQYNDYQMLTQATIGNGFTYTYSYDGNQSLTGISMKNASNVYLYNQAYNFDYTTGNLIWKKDMLKFVTGTQTPFMEEYKYDKLNRIQEVKLNGTVQMSLDYEYNGNIKQKTDISSEQWQYDPNKPNAVSQINNLLVQVPSFNQVYTYNAAKRVNSITDNNGKNLAFAYGPDDERRMTTYTNGLYSATHIYSGDYEKEVTPTETKEYHYIYAPTGLVAVMIKTGSAQSMYYTCTDYLGSIQALLTETGTIAETYNYDVWGQRRNSGDWSYASVTLPVLQHRGYTGHEHLDEFGLINMNARLYDPVIARMLSPDNYVQAPDYTQSYNRYSYCINNPLKYADPTGNIFVIDDIIMAAAIAMVINTGAQMLGGKIKNPGDFWMAAGVGAVAGASGAIVGEAVAGAIGVGGFMGGATVGAASGFTGGFVLTAGNAWTQGASFTDGISAGMVGGVIGGVTGGLITGVVSGIDALNSGADFWDGKVYEVGGFGKNGTFLDEKIPSGHKPTQTGKIATRPENPNYGKYGMVRDRGTRPHYGIDYAGQEGDPVYAMYDGDIIKIGGSSSYGDNFVRTSSQINGIKYNVDYGHMQAQFVTNKTQITAGNLIGEIGRMGHVPTSMPTHVHIAVWRPVDVSGKILQGFVMPSWK